MHFKFPIVQRIYLDNAATTKLDSKVLDAMMPFFTEQFGNASAIYSYGRETRMAIEKSRKFIAQAFNITPSEIFFTSCGTESSNTALEGAVRDLKVEHIITSPIEHHATLYTCQYLASQYNRKLSYVKLSEHGQIDYGDLEKLLQETSGKTLVTLMHANNEIGNMLNLERVSSYCQEYNALFHTDSVQTVGHYPLDLSKLHIDFLSASAHKLHGPKGSGLLYINKNNQIKPSILGGGQERNMRAGTENIANIVGFAKALELAMESFEEDKAYVQALKDRLKTKLITAIPNLVLHGDVDGNSLYTILNVGFPMNDSTEMLSMNLDIQGVCVSGGSACTSGAQGGSHVIRNVYPNASVVPIRFSFSKHNTTEEIDRVVELVAGLINKQ